MCRRLTLSGFLIILLSQTSVVLADVPDSISFQGILLDDKGDPVTTTVTVTFSIYGEESGGSPLWSEKQDVTPDGDGLFNVYLGGGTPSGLVPLNGGLFSEPRRWLEYSIDEGNPLPRIPFTVSPYAYRVESVNGSTGGKISGYVSISGDLGVGVALPQAALHVGGVPGTDGAMFPAGSLQTSAANGPPTSDLWRKQLFVASGGTLTYTNITGATIYITSIHFEGADAAATVNITFAGNHLNSVPGPEVRISGPVGEYRLSCLTQRTWLSPQLRP